MTRLPCVLVLLALVAVPDVVEANRLSETYRAAFLDPAAFELTLLSHVTQDQQYFAKVDHCFGLAEPLLRQLEQQRRAEHQACTNNAECGARAKEVTIVAQMRIKVRDLHRYLVAARTPSPPSFLDSEIGQTAMTTYNAHRALGVSLAGNPVFIQEIAVLSSVPCL